MKQEILDAVVKFKTTGEVPKLTSRYAEYRFKAHYSTPEWHIYNGALYYNNQQVIAEDNEAARTKILQELYDDPATTCSGRDRFYPRVAENYLGITKSDVMKFLSAQETYQLHKQVYHQRAVRPVIALNPAKYLQVDLIDMSDYAYWNGNNRYIMTIIDVFSKRAWAVPMKTRTGPAAAAAIDPILAEVHPRILQSDNGSEFIAAEFGAVCEKHGTKQLFSKSHTPQSQGQIEKFNRTLKSMLVSHFTQYKTRNWTNVLAAKLENYNTTVHTTTKARPNDLFNNPSAGLKAKALSNSSTNSSKTQRFLTYDYSGSNQWAFLIPYSQFAGSNRLLIGGGSADANAATSVEIYAAPNNTTLTGTKIITANTSGLSVNSGTLSVGASANQLSLGASTINCPSSGSRTFTVPDSYQSCNLISNSIICGLTNTSTRPAIANNSTPQSYEIRAFSTTSLSNDDAFLRLRAGGSSFTSSASWIDISGSSTVNDMNRNIVFGAAGAEVARIDNTGVTVKAGYTVNTPTITLPAVSGTLTSFGAAAITISYRYQITGNSVTLMFGSTTGGTTTTSGSVNSTLPAAIAPNSTAVFSAAGFYFPYTVVIGGVTTPALAKIATDGTFSLFANASGGLFSSSTTVVINVQKVTYLIS